MSETVRSMTKLKHDRLREKVLGCLFGVFIGDARGLPAECQSPASIREKFGYLDWYADNKYHPFKNVSRRAAGTKSDDSQLTLALMASIARRVGYDLLDIRKAHVEAADGAFGIPVGWGRTTRHAVENMRNAIVESAIPDGAGNGTVMKIAPLAIYCVYRLAFSEVGRFTNSYNAALLKKCREISELTHGDPACVVACYCQCRMIIRALQDELPKETPTLARMFLEDARYAQEKLQNPACKLAERMEEILAWRFEIAPGQFLTAFDLETAKMSVRICTEHSSYIYNSYPLVAYCTAKLLPFKNFEYAINETVNAGADADSNASMVGAIVGADLGFQAIPSHMVKGLKEWHTLWQAATEFEHSL